MTNMLRANTDITGYDRETTKEMDRLRDARFDNEDQATGNNSLRDMITSFP
jgi:hypothetical protein